MQQHTQFSRCNQLKLPKRWCVAHPDWLINWNCNNHPSSILNVDGSCLGTPIRASYGGVLRNSEGFYLLGFSGFIPNSNDILLAELSTIYHGMIMAIEMGIDDLICYSDTLLSINLISVDTPRYYIYAILVQDIKDLLANRNFSLQHIEKGKLVYRLLG